MSSPTTLATASSIFLGVIMASTSNAETITVCLDGSCDFTDPAAAVQAAADGDVIEVAAGTYLLDAGISFYGVNAVLRGEVDRDGRPATILDAQGKGQVIGFIHTESTNRIENVQIVNGRADYGGGLFLHNADPVFQNCVIRDNVAGFQGGGMFVKSGSSPTFIDCRIIDNISSHPTWDAGTGGAAWLSGDVVLTLVDSEVRFNAAETLGGGIGMNSTGEVILDNSRICGNVASEDPDTSQIYGSGTVTVVSGCVDESCDCVFTDPADLNGDNAVNGADLGLLLANWGQPGTGDLNGDDIVGGADLGLMLAAWSK